jgi:CubicO group peptidase (beta-lactamase class C family)
MSHPMRRREFLVGSSRAAVSFSLFPLVAARAQEDQSWPEVKDATPWETLIADLEKQIPILMKAATVPGLSIAIINDAKLRWRRGFGVKDKATKKPVNNDTMFEAASLSKPVFAYAVMKLCEKGTMDLDTPLTRYTSERFLEGDPWLELISARHLLSHTSGFQSWRSEEEPLKIHFTPGEKFLYSGEGYSYLQSVVTHMTGQPIEPYLKANLFVPFGMTSSGYAWNDTFEKHMARPHDKKGEPLNNRKSTEADVARYGASGALLTTPTDYARFVIEVINPKKSDAFRLSKDSLKEMLRPQVKLSDAYADSWALGWGIQSTARGTVITHGGDSNGFHSIAVASVKRKSGFVIMTNGDNGAELLKRLLLEPLMSRIV